MKTKLLLVLILMLAGFMRSFTAQAQTETKLTGTWRCEAVAAPEGYTLSIMEISEDSVFTTFAGDSYRYGSTLIKFDNDSLVFIIDGLDAKCDLKVEDASKMTGQAVWPDGQSPLVLTRIEDL